MYTIFSVEFFTKGDKHVAAVSARAIDKPGAVRIANARLPLLD